MRRPLIFCLIFFCAVMFSCKKKEKIPEPGYVLEKWSNAIKDFNYSNYCKCEAYPRSDAVFREMYKNEYFTDIAITSVEDVDYDKIEKDYDGNSYIKCSVTFEGTSVKRKYDKPFQAIRGDVLFIKFLDGERQKDGWLISNRSILRINR